MSTFPIWSLELEDKRRASRIWDTSLGACITTEDFWILCSSSSGRSPSVDVAVVLHDLLLQAPGVAEKGRDLFRMGVLGICRVSAAKDSCGVYLWA